MITLTQEAAGKLRELIADKGSEDLAVRVFIKAGAAAVSATAWLWMSRRMRTMSWSPKVSGW